MSNKKNDLNVEQLTSCPMFVVKGDRVRLEFLQFRLCQKEVDSVLGQFSCLMWSVKYVSKM